MKFIREIAGFIFDRMFYNPAVALVSDRFGNPAVTDGCEIKGIRIVKDGMVSLAVLDIGNNEVALIDAGYDKSGKAVLAELGRRGLGPESVRAILLTHGHIDHVGAAALFPEAEIMALAEDVAMAEGRAGHKGFLPRLLPVRPTRLKVTRILKDGEMFNLGNVSVRVFSIPGHTAGSAAFLIDRVLFLGDSAFATRDFRLREASCPFSEDMQENRSSLARLGRLLDGDGIEAIIFSHSSPLMRGIEPLRGFSAKI